MYSIIATSFSGGGSQYFSYIIATSFNGGGSQSTRRESQTMGKQLVNFITCGYKNNFKKIKF
jgi:hypothetical protein